MSDGTFLYPSVTALPGQTAATPAERSAKKQQGVPGEFDKVFDQALESKSTTTDLNQVKAPIKFSAHASQRIKERKIALDPGTLAKVSEALDKAEAKGIEDTLILTKDAALIVNVKNRTVITALDKNSISGNVFTNIDGAVII